VVVGRINSGRVILGGLLAGLVVNIGESILNLVVIGADMEATLKARNLPPVEGGAIGAFVVLAFALGIVTVWLYAAIRPRFGSGPLTAVVAGVTVWLIAYLYPSTADLIMGMYPGGLVATALVWGLVEIVLAAVAGAWLYQET
jgi:hypothetical protein